MQKLEKVSDEEKHKLGLTGDVWKNDLYQVIWQRVPDTFEGHSVVRLSIKRHDRQPMTAWRDKQEIKNQLTDKECEGVELYPAESRKQDQINSYHLWVVEDRTYRIPLGWIGRVVSDDDIEGGN